MQVIEPKFECFGWRSYLQNRKGTSKITINKLVAVGAGLKRGQHLYCYLARDKEDRSIMVVYLDGSPRQYISEQNSEMKLTAE